MAEKKKWENISSDEEDEDVPQQKQVKQEEEPVQKKEEVQKEEQDEEQKEEQPQQQGGYKKHQQKKLPGKAEMIDEIKKIETDQVAVNIFKLDEKATKDDIFKTFSDVNITSIYQNKHIKGSFILYFNEKQQAINFIRFAPRAIKDQQRFMIKLGKVYEKADNSDWNEMGTGGRLVQTLKKPLQTGNKYYDKPKRNYQNYNRKEVNNVYGEDGGEKPYYKKNNNYKGGYKKNYHNNNRNQEQQQQESTEGGEKQEYKPRFYKGGNKKDGQKTESTGQTKEIFGDAKQRDETKFNKFEQEGFQKVENYHDKRKKKESEPKKEEEEDDGWAQAGQKTQQKIQQKKEQVEHQKEEQRKQNYQDKNKPKKDKPIQEKSNKFNKLDE